MSEQIKSGIDEFAVNGNKFSKNTRSKQLLRNTYNKNNDYSKSDIEFTDLDEGYDVISELIISKQTK